MTDKEMKQKAEAWDGMYARLKERVRVTDSFTGLGYVAGMINIMDSWMESGIGDNKEGASWTILSNRNGYPKTGHFEGHDWVIDG